MKPELRIFWLVTLSLFTAGCGTSGISSYSLSDMPPEDQPESGIGDYLKRGDEVGVILVTGERVEGTIQLVTSREIVLDPLANSLQPRGYSAADVQSIEKTGQEATSLAPVLFLTGFVLVAGGIYLASEMSKLNNFMGSN